MEKASDNSKSTEMTDIALARSYVLDIGGKKRSQDVIYEAFRTLRNMFPHDDNPKERWTERRIKSFLYREAPFVKHREMMELYEAAQAKKSERALLLEARKQHAEFIEKTARYRAFLEHQEAARDRTLAPGEGC